MTSSSSSSSSSSIETPVNRESNSLSSYEEDIEASCSDSDRQSDSLSIPPPPPPFRHSTSCSEDDPNMSARRACLSSIISVTTDVDEATLNRNGESKLDSSDEHDRETLKRLISDLAPRVKQSKIVCTEQNIERNRSFCSNKTEKGTVDFKEHVEKTKPTLFRCKNIKKLQSRSSGKREELYTTHTRPKASKQSSWLVERKERNQIKMLQLEVERYKKDGELRVQALKRDQERMKASYESRLEAFKKGIAQQSKKRLIVRKQEGTQTLHPYPTAERIRSKYEQKISQMEFRYEKELASLHKKLLETNSTGLHQLKSKPIENQEEFDVPIDETNFLKDATKKVPNEQHLSHGTAISKESQFDEEKRNNLRLIQLQNRVDTLVAVNNNLRSRISTMEVDEPVLARYASLSKKILLLEEKAQLREEEIRRAVENSKSVYELESRKLQSLHEEELAEKDRQIVVFRERLQLLMKQVQSFISMAEVKHEENQEKKNNLNSS